MILDEILYQCRDFDRVLLLRIWGAVGYASLLVSRQYRSRQFITVTQGLAQCEFSYKCDNYKKRVREMSNAWNQTHRMKILVVGSSMTPEYSQSRDQRVNDNIPMSNLETTQSLEEHLQVMPSEMEIIKQDFKKRSLELGRKIKQLEEEKMQLGLDVDVQKLEADKLRKGKNKVEEDLDSLKTDNRKLRRSIRIASLGKTSEQWRQEIRKERTKDDQWEKKFQNTRAREVALKRSLLVSQNENAKLKVRVTELEKSLHQHHSRNFVFELKTSLSKIEELRGKIEELKDALQNSKLRIKLLERGEAVAQVCEVADHLQTLVVQVDVLSLKYESESDRGRELAWLLRKVKALSIRAKPYM
ncbi:hypothetical protein Golob_024196 [Gossypium lobatum]|uniref:Uncharacterized protein n=1 Tax=Gossypium lobatum TaxID=34289 RepID=A0A7J8NGU1_9ROSI|nr:hypothetical protein [Gossypium lobatum]